MLSIVTSDSASTNDMQSVDSRFLWLRLLNSRTTGYANAP